MAAEKKQAAEEMVRFRIPTGRSDLDKQDAVSYTHLGPHFPRLAIT